MRLITSARVYARHARGLSRYWNRPLVSTTAKLLLGRVLYGRGPHEFNHYRFTVKPVRAWRDYVVDVERRRLQRRAAPAAFRRLEEDKVLFWERCADAGLPTVPITAVLATAGAAPTDPPSSESRVDVVRTGAELRDLLQPLGPFAGFAKPVGGGQGYGAFAFEVRGSRVSTSGGELSLDELYDHCMSLPFAAGGYAIQPHLRAHPGLADIMPGPGLGTIRMVTFLAPDGTVEVPWAVLKTPGQGRVVNTRRLGALMAPVDLGTGRLGTAVGPAENTWVVDEVEVHPETGARFDDVVVPEWTEVMALVERGAREFSELPGLGWDVAITDEGPLLLETNWGFGTAVQQITLDRGLRTELRERYARCTKPGGVGVT